MSPAWIVNGCNKKREGHKSDLLFVFSIQQLVTIAATAAVSAAAASATAATAAATTTISAATTAATTFVTRFAWSGLVDDHWTPLMLFAVEPFDGLAGFIV
jgi:hypothetical protein